MFSTSSNNKHSLRSNDLNYSSIRLCRREVTIKIIFEDENLLIIDKPAGLVVDSGESVKEETLADILIKDFGIQLPRGGIVHRLDKDTSGILLVAKTREALENLQAQFKERIIKKEYLTLVHGLVTESGKVDAAIMRNPRSREKFTVALQGEALEAREAVTEYEPVKNLQFTIYNLQTIFSDFNEQSSRAGFHPLTKIQMRKLEKQRYGEFTLLRCKPRTGRTHQIRVHLKYIGSPIVSDEKYGGRKTYRLDKRWCPRMFLHAAKIGFNHPVSGKWMELENELPEDLRGVLESLRSLEQ